jgi:hypothetical protein
MAGGGALAFFQFADPDAHEMNGAHFANDGMARITPTSVLAAIEAGRPRLSST